MSKLIFFIPARGGSKRSPGKHKFIVAGKTIVAHAIAQAIRVSEKIEHTAAVVFSSDDDELVAMHARQAGLQIHARDAALAGDHVGLIRVVQEYILQEGAEIEEADILVLLLSTNILRSDLDILGGLELYEHWRGSRAVISVSELDYPIEMLFRKNGDFLEFDDTLSTTRKQDLTKGFYYNDAFIIDSVKGWRERNLLFASGMVPYVMPALRSFHVDYNWQAELSRVLMESGLMED